MAALPFFNADRSSLPYLRRNKIDNRFFLSRFLERVEMEPARLWRAVRIVDLRCLCGRGFNFARAAIPVVAIQRD